MRIAGLSDDQDEFDFFESSERTAEAARNVALSWLPAHDALACRAEAVALVRGEKYATQFRTGQEAFRGHIGDSTGALLSSPAWRFVTTESV